MTYIVWMDTFRVRKLLWNIKDKSYGMRFIELTNPGKFVPGEAVCHNKTIDIAIDSPEEVCDLQPQKMCKQVFYFRIPIWVDNFLQDRY